MTAIQLDACCRHEVLTSGVESCVRIVIRALAPPAHLQHSCGSTMSALLDHLVRGLVAARFCTTAMYMFILQCILPGTISAGPPGPVLDLACIHRRRHRLASEVAVGCLDRRLVELHAAIHACRGASRR